LGFTIGGKIIAVNQAGQTSTPGFTRQWTFCPGNDNGVQSLHCRCKIINTLYTRTVYANIIINNRVEQNKGTEIKYSARTTSKRTGTGVNMFNFSIGLLKPDLPTEKQKCFHCTRRSEVTEG
jgi:hypothetical protein